MNYNDFRAEKMQALKDKDQKKNSVVTMILSAITYQAKDLGRDLTDEECLAVVAKQLKQVRESIELSQGREDILVELNKEVAILESYLPKPMSEAEVAEEIKRLLQDAGFEAVAANKGQIMKLVMAELKGKAEGKLINQIVAQQIK